MVILLPFSEQTNRIKRFTHEMEKATIFCLSEIERNKGGVIRKKTPERISFIMEVCYPLWLIPWKKHTLLFDGLGLRKHIILFDILPDANMFLKEIQTNTNNTEKYLDFLVHNVNYFESFAGKAKRVTNALLCDSSFLDDFEHYLPRAKQVRGSISNKLVLTPFISEETIESSIVNLSELRNDLKLDLDKLNEIMKTVIKLTDKHIKNLMKLNEKITIDSEKDIFNFKSEAFEKTEKLRKIYDEKILKIKKDHEKKIKLIQKPQTKLEKRKVHLSEYLKSCKSEIANHKEQKDEKSHESWNEECQKTTSELFEINKKLSKVMEEIKNRELARDIQIAQFEAEFDAQSKALSSGLEKIEKSLDSKIKLNEERINSLKDASSSFTLKINNLADLRKSTLADFTRIGIKKTRRRYSIAHIPFYLTCYEQEFKRRYSLFSPSYVKGMRGVTKIKGVFKSSKITVILNERSEAITKFLNTFLRMVDQNPIFEEKLVEAGIKVDILGTKDKRIRLAKGLNRLMEEGWLSESEQKILLKQILKKQ